MAMLKWPFPALAPTPRPKREDRTRDRAQSLRVRGLDYARKNDVKTRAARRVVRGPQAAVVRFNDGAADGQSHTGSMKLRRKECIEDLVRLLQGQPHAGIADAHRELPVFDSLRLDGELARPILILHS